MANILGFVLNSLSTVGSALISDPIKSIGAFASIGTLILNWKIQRKDATKVKVVVKRADNSSFMLQFHKKNF
jgi:hypothetical protein